MTEPDSRPAHDERRHGRESVETSDPRSHERRYADKTTQFGRWTVLEYDVVASTNLLAARLPAWHAARADRQHAGRGRYQRTWISDRGGLWLSAVLPSPASRGLKLLPLAVGVAVCDALHRFGVKGLHLRWPNDILVGQRKLAGLLIDQFVPGRTVVGIGINVTNRPEEKDPTLYGHVLHLHDLAPAVPALTDLMHGVLAALEEVASVLHSDQPENLLPRINALWPKPLQVQLEVGGQDLAGGFEGVDIAGRLKLRLPSGEIAFYEPHQVGLLRELVVSPTPLVHTVEEKD